MWCVIWLNGLKNRYDKIFMFCPKQTFWFCKFSSIQLTTTIPTLTVRINPEKIIRWPPRAKTITNKHMIGLNMAWFNITCLSNRARFFSKSNSSKNWCCCNGSPKQASLSLDHLCRGCFLLVLRTAKLDIFQISWRTNWNQTTVHLLTKVARGSGYQTIWRSL